MADPEFDEIELTFTWEGNAGAVIHLIVDNDDLVATDRDGLAGATHIVHRYRVARGALHVIEWSLQFERSTLRKLLARAVINGAAPVTVGARDERKHAWVDRGTAP